MAATMTALESCEIICATARKYGLRPHQLMLRAGNGKGAHWQLVSQAKREAALAMRDAGASLPAIGRALNCGHQPVWRALRKHGGAT
jgi:hypothetical protein